MKVILSNRSVFFILFMGIGFAVQSQNLLPPVNEWNGKSTALIAKANDPLITIAEKSNFTQTATYEETMQWLKKISTSPSLKMVTIGKSLNGRDIVMIIVSNDNTFDAVSLAKSSKPLILAQAGIHAGEIDGKDAGLMLLRDIVSGKKSDLLGKVNFAFIPILNVDGHERSSPYNRANQRGPENMGWRTNARNQNLNRDYAKLDTEEIKAVINVINQYDPDLYIDLHVTDGADYQYDITYGFHEESTYSPEISRWMKSIFTVAVDQHLSGGGHIPGPLLFSVEDHSFLKGNYADHFPPRFSHSYGDVRHLPTVLVENHSLKPYRQRVLGTYLFLEGALKVMSASGPQLIAAMASDRNLRSDSLALTFKRTTKTEITTHLGIESKVGKSSVTDKDYVEWTGKKLSMEIPVIRINQVDKAVKVPKAFWVPATHPEVIKRLQHHGIKMEILSASREVELTMYRISNQEFGRGPSEGHMTVKGVATKEIRKEIFHPGSARIETNQDLGYLTTLLLEPESLDSFFQWGFFLEIFNRTEYAEGYVMEPLAQNMLKDESLRKEFEKKKQEDAKFAADARAIYDWFYRKSPYADHRYLLYPVGLEY